jgi:hypothetical protein
MNIAYIDGVPELLTADCANKNVHRIGGPAVILADGSKIWYINGERHRTDGPAYEGADGHYEWYLHGEHYSFNEFLKKLPMEQAVLVALEWK